MPILWYQLSGRCSSRACLVLQDPILTGHSVFPGASFHAPRWAAICQEHYCLCREIAQGMLFCSYYYIYAEIAQDSPTVCGKWDTCQGRNMWDLLALGSSLPRTIQQSTELCLPLYHRKKFKGGLTKLFSPPFKLRPGSTVPMCSVLL